MADMSAHGGPLANVHPQVKRGGYVTLKKPAYNKSESIAVPIALPRKRQQRLHQLERRPVHARRRSPWGGRCPPLSLSLCATLTAAIPTRLPCAPAVRMSRLGMNSGARCGGCGRSRWKTTTSGTQQAGGRSDWAGGIGHMEEGRVQWRRQRQPDRRDEWLAKVQQGSQEDRMIL